MDRQQAQDIVRDTFESPFDKGRFVGFIKNLLNSIEDAPFSYKGNLIPDAYEQYISSLERIGKYTDGEHKIDILVVKLKKETSIERARTMQRNFIAWYLNGSRGGEMKDAALVAFVSPNEEDWRFSLVKMDYRFEEGKGGRVKVKEEFTPARRWSFLVGENENSHTAQSKLYPIIADDEHDPALAELEEAFNIEKVTKEFFEKYRDLFLRTKETLNEVVVGDKNIKADFEAKGVNTVDFAKKLLGQIVFLYFLQKKGWFGVGRDAEWGTGSKHFLRELFKKKHSDYKNFFNDILEPLFYEALRVGEERKQDDYYYSRFNCKIPFLNGGLFDPIGNNGGYDWVHTDIILSDSLFSNKNKTKEGDEGDGILDIFDRYNFTVREDEPLEKEVAIDPELLGKAYEKFNAIRPDNFEEYKKALKSGNKGEESKFNKQYGVYYTPREIVHYMCQQSLINYLYSALNEDMDSVMAENFPSSVIPARRESFLKKDAGQAGMTEQLKEDESVKKISREDIEMLIKYGEQVGENEARVESRGKETKTYSYKLPESIRQNAQLIDEKLANIKVCDPAVGSGAFPVGMMSEIVKARNVLSTFLSSSQQGSGNNESPLPLRERDRVRGKDRTIYDFKRHCIEKSLYGVDIDSGAVEIAKLRLWLSLVVDEDNIKNIKPLPNLDYKIVCGNSLMGLPDGVLINDEISKKLEENKNLYFKSTNPSEKNKIRDTINILFLKLIDSMKEFDPSIQDINFDFHTHFSEVFHHKGGFDVVIANPPYIRQEDLKPIKPILEKQGYQVYNSTSDIYTYFYEKGWQVLNDAGHLTFITSNKWMRAKYGEKLRKFFKEKTALRQIIDFGGHKVFESATVDTNILILQKDATGCHSCESRNPVKILTIKSDPRSESRASFNHNIDLAGYFNQNAITMNQQDLDEKCFTFGDDAVMRLKKKIEQAGTPLKDWGVKINRGIVTGFNEAFIIDNETKERLCKEDPKSIEVLKPILRGRDIQRYSYKWAGLWVIATFPALNLDIDKYPAIKDYLKSFGKRLHQTGEKGCRKKTGNKWFETQDQIAYWQEFEKEKIIYPNMTKFLPFVYDDKNFYTNQKCYILTNQNNGTILKFSVSLLNSNLFSWYIRIIFPELQGGTRELNENVFSNIPIPKIPESAQQSFITLVDQILAAKKQPPSSPFGNGELPNADTSALERQIDEMVYALYGLTPDEIAIVEGKGK